MVISSEAEHIISKQISKKGKGAIISVKVTKREGVNYYSKLRAG